MKRPDFLKKDYHSELIEDLTALLPVYEDRLKESSGPEVLDWELCSQGLFSEADLLLAYAKVSEIDVIDDDDIDSEIEQYPDMPMSYLTSQCLLPMSWDAETINLLVCDPYSIETTMYFFKEIHKKEVTFNLAKRSTIEHLLNMVYKGEAAEEEADDFSGDESEETLRSLASEAKIVRLVNEMFARAAELMASDIHVEPEENRMVVRFRIDGMLQEIITTPLSQFPAVASRIKLVGGLNIAENRLPQDGRTNLKIGRSEMDIRVSTIPTMHGESIVLRILRKDALSFDLSKIGMSKRVEDDFSSLAKHPHGIILVVGPTGSGKTTTLYSVLNMLNTRDRKIITIEDPVEYKTSGLSQMQVNHKIGLDFASGLRNIVRQDPDVILVGEIRDRETADIAINAALTGHLVLSTLHTNTAAGAVSRLQDMGIENFLITSSLIGVLSQRLIRCVCDICNGKGEVEDNKCKRCNGSGMRGRTGIYEMMTVNDELRKAINDNMDSGTISKIAVKNGMVPLLEDGSLKVEAGITTEKELARAVASH